MLYCPNCGGPLIEQNDYLLCTLCCASFRRTDNKIQLFHQFNGNKHIREFMEVLQNEMRSNAEETETKNVSRREELLEPNNESLSQTSNDDES